MNTKTDCFSDDVLTRFVLNRLRPEVIDKIERHVQTCDSCLRRLDEVEQTTGIDQLVLGSLVRHPGETRPYDLNRLIVDAVCEEDFRSQYELREELAKGRYAARRVSSGETCWVHFPACSRNVLERLAKQTLRLPHLPGVLSVEDVGCVRQLNYYVTPEINGITLLEWCGNAPLTSIAALFLSLIETLRETHRRDFFHGGLQPERVLVVGSQPVLLEFGIALEEQPTASHDYRGVLHLLERVAQTGAFAETAARTILRETPLDDSFFDELTKRLQRLIDGSPDQPQSDLTSHSDR